MTGRYRPMLEALEQAISETINLPGRISGLGLSEYQVNEVRQHVYEQHSTTYSLFKPLVPDSEMNIFARYRELEEITEKILEPLSGKQEINTLMVIQDARSLGQRLGSLISCLPSSQKRYYEGRAGAAQVRLRPKND